MFDWKKISTDNFILVKELSYQIGLHHQIEVRSTHLLPRYPKGDSADWWPAAFLPFLLWNPSCRVLTPQLITERCDENSLLNGSTLWVETKTWHGFQNSNRHHKEQDRTKYLNHISQTSSASGQKCNMDFDCVGQNKRHLTGWAYFILPYFVFLFSSIFVSFFFFNS